jgi:hypothetical protein
VAGPVQTEPTNIELPYDAKYPYTPRPAPATSSQLPAVRQSFPWRSFWLWTGRAAVVLSALLLVVAIAVGIVAYRAASQAWLIAELERSNSTVLYWDQPPQAERSLSGYLRDRLGDPWWGDVRAVSLGTEGYWESFFFRYLKEDDVMALCAACGRFSKLQKFEVKSNLFSCRHLSNWPSLQKLEELDVENANLSDADLAIIGRMTGLKRLKIGAASITSEGLGHLARLPNLESLTLERIQFTRSRQADPSGFSALQRLTIVQSSEFGDDAFASFGSPPNLEEVHFNQTRIGDQRLAQLIGNGKVRLLHIFEGELTDASLKVLASHTAPKSLVLSRMPLTNKGLHELAGKEFPDLGLDHTAITDEGFRALAEIKGLEHVNLAGTKVTGTGVSLLNSDTLLKHLDLSGAALTPAGIQALAKANISELVLSHTSIGDQELLLFANSDKLTALDVTNTSVTAAGVRAFYKARQSRLKAAGMVESLSLSCDFPGVVASVLGFDPASGMSGGSGDYAIPMN